MTSPVHPVCCFGLIIIVLLVTYIHLMCTSTAVALLVPHEAPPPVLFWAYFKQHTHIFSLKAAAVPQGSWEGS